MANLPKQPKKPEAPKPAPKVSLWQRFKEKLFGGEGTPKDLFR